MTAEGFEALQRRLDMITHGQSDRIDKAIGRGAARMQSAVKMLTPVDTGNLRNKIIVVHQQSYTYTVETNVEYAMFVEYGTGKFGDPVVPHTSRDSWAYYSDKLKRFVTTSGQKPAHMFTQGFAQTYKDVVRTVYAEIKEILRNG